MSQLDELKEGKIVTVSSNIKEDDVDKTIDVEEDFFANCPDNSEEKPITDGASSLIDEEKNALASITESKFSNDVEEAANRRLGIMYENAAVEKEKLDKENMEREVEESESEIETEAAVDGTETNITPTAISDDDEDLLSELGLNDEEDDDDDIEKEVEESTRVKSEEELKVEREEFITNVKEKLLSDLPDVSSFEIASTSVPVNQAINKRAKTTRDWPMITSGKVAHLQGLDGADIDVIYNNIESMGKSVHAMNAIARVIYDSITNQTKPDYIQWLKITPWDDFSGLLNGIYYPTFSGANYLPVTCTKKDCETTFLTDSIDIDSMADFPSNEIKTKFYETLSKNDTDISEKLKERIAPISKNLALGIHAMSIYSVFFEPSVIGDKMRNKYQADGTLNLLQSIENIYIIGSDKRLHPVAYKTVIGNDAKTLKYRYATFNKVLKELSSEEFNYAKSLLKDAMNTEETMKFKVPEQTCPKCGEKIPASSETGLSLLLEHHQLTLTLSL